MGTLLEVHPIVPWFIPCFGSPSSEAERLRRLAGGYSAMCFSDASMVYVFAVRIYVDTVQI